MEEGENNFRVVCGINKNKYVGIKMLEKKGHIGPKFISFIFLINFQRKKNKKQETKRFSQIFVDSDFP